MTTIKKKKNMMTTTQCIITALLVCAVIYASYRFSSICYRRGKGKELLATTTDTCKKPKWSPLLITAHEQWCTSDKECNNTNKQCYNRKDGKCSAETESDCIKPQASGLKNVWCPAAKVAHDKRQNDRKKYEECLDQPCNEKLQNNAVFFYKNDHQKNRKKQTVEKMNTWYPIDYMWGDATFNNEGAKSQVEYVKTDTNCKICYGGKSYTGYKELKDDKKFGGQPPADHKGWMVKRRGARCDPDTKVYGQWPGADVETEYQDR